MGNTVPEGHGVSLTVRLPWEAGRHREGVNCLKGPVVQGPNAAESREREVRWVEISVGDEGKFGRERHWSGGPVPGQSSRGPKTAPLAARSRTVWAGPVDRVGVTRTTSHCEGCCGEEGALLWGEPWGSSGLRTAPGDPQPAP